MTTEVILLLSLFAFILLGVFMGDSGPRSVFGRSGPRLGARIEAQLTTGRGFISKDGGTNLWSTPPVASPAGEF